MFSPWKANGKKTLLDVIPTTVNEGERKSQRQAGKLRTVHGCEEKCETPALSPW